jgi:YVTN family beta-propeller protein
VFVARNDLPFFDGMPEIRIGVPLGIAIEQDGGTSVYVADSGSGNLIVFNTETYQLIGAPISVGAHPQNVAILSHPDSIINFHLAFNEVARFGALFNLVGLLTTLSAPVDDPSLVSSVSWDFYGDGSAISTTSTLSTQFTYTRAGTFNPKVTVYLKNGTQATRSTSLLVQSPLDAIGTTVSLVNWLQLSNGRSNSLLAKLDAASSSLGRANTNAACGQLQAFGNELNAVVQSGESNTAAVSPVSGEAQAIQSSLRCQ